MRKLIQGIINFRKDLTEEKRALFAKLAIEQKPDALFIACSDSRVVPNLFASTDPGDLFVLRNVGNLIPPAQAHDNSAAAVLEFAVFSLGVSNIIVCGHSECGAMRLLMKRSSDSCCSHLKTWLKYGEGAIHSLRKGVTINPNLSEHNQLSQCNVLQQIEHVKSYPFVKERIEKRKLQVHGWWFDIAHADVYAYEKHLKQFILIDDEEAKFILNRL